MDRPPPRRGGVGVIRYQMFHAVIDKLDDRGLARVARRSGVPVERIVEAATGDALEVVDLSLSDQMRVAEALGRINPFDLFALDADVESAYDRKMPRYVVDQSALRTIDR